MKVIIIGKDYLFPAPKGSKEFIEITEQQYAEYKSGLLKLNDTRTELEAVSEQELTLQRNNARITELKQRLSDTDYQAIKYAEGHIAEADYAAMKAQRQEWRDEINRLEAI